jgi:hypothetical protein
MQVLYCIDACLEQATSHHLVSSYLVCRICKPNGVVLRGSVSNRFSVRSCDIVAKFSKRRCNHQSSNSTVTTSFSYIVVYETFEKMQEEHDSDIPQQTRLLQLQWHWQHAIANPSYSHPHRVDLLYSLLSSPQSVPRRLSYPHTRFSG